MILLTVEEILSLHNMLIEKTGGSHGVRDLGLLESAVYSTENSAMAHLCLTDVSKCY